MNEANLAKAGIQTGIHYEQPLPRTLAFSASGDDCPAAERRARLQLSLPMHPHLTQADVEQIASAVTSVVSTARKRDLLAVGGEHGRKP